MFYYTKPKQFLAHIKISSLIISTIITPVELGEFFLPFGDSSKNPQLATLIAFINSNNEWGGEGEAKDFNSQLNKGRDKLLNKETLKRRSRHE